ncbi:MAG: sporulation initiation factor Spo0A C-terminal domain-containing protein [Angelakisella sp.]
MSMRNVFRKIAKENGVTLAEVKHDMQAAIDAAYSNPPDDGITKAYQQKVPRKNEVPTVEEFVHYAANELKSKSR